MYKNARDPISFLTHFIGAVVGAILILVTLIYGYLNKSSSTAIISVLVFTVSIVLLYSASSMYHYVKAYNKNYTFYHKLDHAMIYVLIAGSYTPFCLNYLQDGKTFMFFIWLAAIIGIIGKIFWLKAPRLLYTLLYVMMGWAIVFKFNEFVNIPKGFITFISLGGVSYTIGAIIYIIKKPNLSSKWGFHELFHLFILLGTLKILF